MADERRSTETTGLRGLFQEQWLYFLELLDNWNQRRDAAHQQTREILTAIESVVVGTDARIRAVSDYKNRLRDSVRGVLAYVDDLVTKMPGAVTVNENAFSYNSLVNSFFVNTHDIRCLFSRCRELHSFFTAPENNELTEVYALLSVVKTEKNILGKAWAGELLISDVKQEVVNFSDHHITSPCSSEELARASLKAMFLDNIIEYVKCHMTQLRCRQQENHTSIESSLKNPSIYLDELIKLLNDPGKLLTFNNVKIRINKVGIKIDGRSDDACNELTLNEITIGHFPAHIITLIKYPRCELLPYDHFMPI